MWPSVQELVGVTAIIVILVGVFLGEHLPKWDRHRKDGDVGGH